MPYIKIDPNAPKCPCNNRRISAYHYKLKVHMEYEQMCILIQKMLQD